MTKPKNMTPEQEAEWKARRRESDRKYSANNPDKRRKNRRKWRDKYPEKCRELRRRWKSKNYKIHLESRRRINQKSQLNLTDSYIAGLFEIPVSTLRQFPELIELKRKSIILHRLHKQLTKHANESPKNKQ